MKTSTLQPFNAAVVAIACTLLVLELDAPETGKLDDLFNMGSNLLAHYNSFSLIYLFWYMHAREIERVDSVSPFIVLLNNFWLLFITFIPFATDWVENFPDQTTPQLIIILDFTACYFLNNWIIKLMIDDNPNVKFSIKTPFRDRIPIYILLIAALINSFFFPILNVLIIFLLTLFFIYWIFKNRKKDLRL